MQVLETVPYCSNAVKFNCYAISTKRLLSLTVNLQVYFLYYLVSHKAVSLDHYCFSSILTIYIFHINIHNSLLTFADDTKCFGPVTSCTDEQLLQCDIDLLLDWSSRSYLCFNPTKCVHISFRATSVTSYHLNEQAIPKLNS